MLTAFLSGSDLFVDKTLKGAIANVEESEFRIQTVRDNPSLNSEVGTQKSVLGLSRKIKK